jgi:enamine deaminase RidA (YjgF/YER057c/UK114 family)
MSTIIPIHAPGTRTPLGHYSQAVVANGLVFVSLFISRLEDWGAINATYARIMGDHRPSRAIVPVAPLHHGAGIEIQCIAILPGGKAAGRKGGKAGGRNR